MTVITTPAPARTDARPEATSTAAVTPLVRRSGIAVAVGAVVWAGSMFTVGPQPDTELGVTISDLAAVPFQLSLVALVTAQLRTGATGTTRAARGMLRVEYVLLGLATLWSILHGAVPAFRDDLWLGILDGFWPLSMLGMFIIGVKILFAGRWRGTARAWPAIAESWAVVTVPATIALGPEIGTVVGGGHLLVGYAVLGLILALRPQLTGAAG